MIRYSLHRAFFFLLLIFLPTQLGYHFWPAWAMVLGRRVDYLSPTIYFTDVLLVLTIISWVLEKFSLPRRQAGIFNFQFSKIIPWILFLCFVGVNIFFAQSHEVAIYKWIKVLEFSLLGLYIFKTKPSLSSIVYPLSIGVFYSSLIAIMQFFLQHSIGGPLWWLGERTFSIDTPGIARVQLRGEMLRAYGAFPHPNVLGGFLAAVLPLTIIQFSNNQILKLSNKIFYAATLLLGVLALVVTFSRSAMLTMIIVSSLIVMHKSLFEKKKTWIPAFAGMTMVALIFFALPFSSRDESVVVRQQLNAVALRQWQSSPLVGVGIGNFLVELPKTLPSRAIYFLQPVHNIYLLVLSETGIIGFILFLLLIWKSIQAGIFSTLYPLFSILLLGLVDHYPLTLQQGQMLFTIFLALAVSREK